MLSIKPHHNLPVILNLFQDPAHGKSYYFLNFVSAPICTGKKILQKLYIFIGGQMLKQRISAGLKAPCEVGRYSGRTPIIQDKFSMTRAV
jgi:hypothetical protein